MKDLSTLRPYQVRLTAGGELTAQLPPEQAELARRLLCLSYCRAHQTLR